MARGARKEMMGKCEIERVGWRWAFVIVPDLLGLHFISL